MTGREDNLSHRCHFTMDSRLRGNDVVGALQQCLNNLVSTYWQARKMALYYVGVTSNLVQRIWQHKSDQTPGFTQQYQVHTLVYFELHETMESAITREKQIKKWNRQWKINLIEEKNLHWNDLWESIQ